MKFGRSLTNNLTSFELPNDHPGTKNVIEKSRTKDIEVRLGLPKWGKADLEHFYPRGTTDLLKYYSTQFNAIEFNAFFYRIFKPEQVTKWKNQASDDFKFFPKIPQLISQFRRLKSVEDLVDEFLFSISHFEEKLGSCFLQMHPSFSPQSFKELERFIEQWPMDVELAVELRHPDWYNDSEISEKLYGLLDAYNISNVITDTVGRRDLIHMRLTNSTAFVRFTAANQVFDEDRIDDWIQRLKIWTDEGLQKIYFFTHINAEKESPVIPAMFVEKLTKSLHIKLKTPTIL
jgi:uncharacterized protein YecE (DUF72 family)